MQQTIWKFEALVQGQFTITMPPGAVLLTIQVQRGDPVLWAVVDPAKSEHLVTRRFYVYGTGHVHKQIEGKYIATVQLPNGLVFHYFDGGEC